MEKEVTANELDIKFMSPLVVRSRIDRKDYYYSFNDQDFLDTLKMNIKEQLKITNISTEIVDGFNIETIKSKKSNSKIL